MFGKLIKDPGNRVFFFFIMSGTLSFRSHVHTFTKTEKNQNNGIIWQEHLMKVTHI